MVQKKGHISMRKHHLFGLVTAVSILSALWCQSFVSLADSTGTVTVESAVIREKADTSGEAVGSAVRGNTVTIKGETQDSSGTLWYEVVVDGDKTGYIRSDLVDKQGGDSDAGASQTSSNDTDGQDAAQSGTPGAMIAPDTVMDAQYAAVSANSINVRATPSANDSAVGKLTRDAEVIVSGQSNGSDGKVWYYVIFTDNDGTEKSGYIRSDLLSLGDMVPVPEEETSEPQEFEPEPEESYNHDYELTHEPSDDGTDGWYLWDYTGGTGLKYPVDQLMEATKQRSENEAADAKTLVKQRIVIVVLIVLIVILIVAVVIMALKLRDVYYEDYEDEEEEEEEEEEEPPVRRRRRTEEDEAPSQRRRRTEEDETPSQRRRRAEEDDTSAQRRRRTDEDGSARRRRRTEDEDDVNGAPSVPKKKPKNFLLDDDEFEFEFLNMDDKNL